MTGPRPDAAGIQRQGAKPQRRNRIFLLRNQETRKHRKDFMVSGLPYGIVLSRAFAPWRLCVKSFLHGGRPQRPGQKANSHARPGWGRMRTEFNAKAQSDFFLLRNQETKNRQKDFMVSGLPYGIVLGRAFAPLRLCVKSFCMMADCKVWPSAWWLTARSGRPQGPGQKANGQRMAGPGPDWPALPEPGPAQPRLRWRNFSA